MAYKYHTQLSNSFFDKFIELLSRDGFNQIVIYDNKDNILVSCKLPNRDFVFKKTDNSLEIIASESALAILDGVAVKGAIFNGEDVKLVEFDVGSAMVNPLSELILNSVVIYKGGAVTINSISLTV